MRLGGYLGSCAASCYGGVEVGDCPPLVAGIGAQRTRQLSPGTAWSPSTTSMCLCAVTGNGTAYVVHMMSAAAAGCHVDHRAIDQFATGTSVRSQDEVRSEHSIKTAHGT